MKYHSVIKWAIKLRKDEELECILLSEKSQFVKTTYCIILTIWHSEKGKTMETVKRSVVVKGYEKVETEDS